MQDGQLRTHRQLRGWSQDDLVRELVGLGIELGERQLGVSASLISRWEHGVTQPRAPYPKLLCRLFNATAEELGLVSPSPLRITSTELLGQAAGGFSHVPSVNVDEVLALLTDPRASAATVRTLNACIADYWRRDNEYGGEAVRPAILGHLRYVLNLLKGSHPEALTRELHAIGAELACLVGWTYFDAQQFALARSYFTEAMGLARAIEDHLFMANVLSYLSLQATYEDKPADAASFVQAALGLIQRRHVPRVMALLKMREAFALASLGDRSGCHHALNAAQNAFGRVNTHDDTPTWASYFDETKLIVDTGIAHGRMEEYEKASRLIEQALQAEDRRHSRPLAFHYFWLATAQLGLGDLDQACQTATNTLTLSLNLDSVRTLSHIRDFQGQLGPYRGEKVVHEFERRVQGAFPV